MKRLLTLAILASLVLPATSFAQRRGGGYGQQKRIHTPGTGQQTGTAVQQRQRKRDGTGPNCTGNCTGAQTRQQTKTQQQTPTEQQTRTQQQTQTSNPK